MILCSSRISNFASNFAIKHRKHQNASRSSENVWREYKQDTDSVASWLASTAKARGFTAGLLTPVAAPKKKKKRTQKRVPTKYIVAIKDFVPLAKFIADCENPVVDVPASFVTTINRVIDVRSSFSNQLIEHGVKIEKRSQSTHAHFTGILKQVREALRPRMQTATATWQESSSSFFADALPSSFGALELDEPSQCSKNAPDIKRPEPDKGVDMAVYEAEQAAYSELEDAMFAYSVMLEDLRKIRVQIVSMWENYHNGVIDLAVAAVATNTAIELARNVADEVIPLFRSHGGVWRIARLHYFAAALSGGFSLEDLGLSVEGANNGVTFNCKTYDIANATYTIAYKFLKEFQAVLQPNMLPLFKPGFFGTYDPTSKFETKSPEDMAVIRSLPDWPVEDEFLRGMRDMDTTKDVPFYLVFAAQVFLDIHHILGDEVERGFQEMSTETNIMRNNLESHLEFHKDLKIDSWTTKHDAPLIYAKSVIEWLGTDPINKIIVDRARKEGMSLSPKSRQYSLLRQSPVMSGLILHHFRLELYDIGISVANAWGSITYTEHLYNAVAKEGLLEGRWDDMHVVRSSFGPGTFYVGEPPSTPEDYHKMFCLQMGASAAFFAKDGKRRANVPLTSRSGPRGIEKGAPVSVMFQDRYTRRGSGMDWTAERVDNVLSRSEWEEEDRDDGVISVARVTDPKQLAEIRKGKKKKLASDRGRLPPEKLIRSLLWALQSETSDIAFSYPLMHRRCWELLRGIKDQCDPLLRELFTPAYIDHERQLPFVVGWILRATAGFGEPLQDRRLLETAAVVLNSFISEGGSICGTVLEIIGVHVRVVDDVDTDEELDGKPGITKIVSVPRLK